MRLLLNFILLFTLIESSTFGQTSHQLLLSYSDSSFPDSLVATFNPDSLFLSNPILQINNQYSGSFISKNGLILTSKKALKDKGLQLDQITEKEIPLEGWYARRQLYGKEVTDQILDQVDSSFSTVKRSMTVDRNIRRLIQNTPTKEFQKLEVEAINGGRQYVLYAYEIFSDLRLVYSSPEEDYILLRAYRQNEVFSTDTYLQPLSEGPSKSTWATLIGYPKRSFSSVLPLQKVKFFYDILPTHLDRRNAMLSVWEKQEQLNPQLTQQLDRLKQEQATWEELAYQSLILYIPSRLELQHNKILGQVKANHPYRQTLSEQEKLLEEWTELEEVSLSFEEILYKHLQLFRVFRQIVQIEESYSRSDSEQQERMQTALADFYESFDPALEVDLLEKALTLYFQEIPVEYQSPEAGQKYAEAKKDLEEMARIAFSSSLFFKPKLVQAKLEQGLAAFRNMFQSDYLFTLWELIDQEYQSVKKADMPPVLADLRQIQNHFYDLLEEQSLLLPEANGHLRFSVGAMDTTSKTATHHILKGMEGAPLINERGELVGMFTEGESALLDLEEWIYEEGLVKWPYLEVGKIRLKGE